MRLSLAPGMFFMRLSRAADEKVSRLIVESYEKEITR